MTADDRRYIREALDLAREGRGVASPHPMVGALVVDANGHKVGSGSHTYEGVKHAEVIALEQAGEAARGGTLYCSLEPCNHDGRTPPCTDAVLSSGVRHVVIACRDEDPRVTGKGIERLRDAGVDVEIADEFVEEAQRLNEAFFHYARTGRPLLTLKTAVTLDGKIAAPDDNSGWLTSDIARAHVQQVRHDQDAIMTGIGTVIADDCLMTDRSGLPRRRPLLRVVLDSLLRLPFESRLVQTFDHDLVVMTTSAAPAERRAAFDALGIPVLIFDTRIGRVDLEAVLRWLGEQHMISVLLEAGAKLNWAALDGGLVDKTLIYYAPKILGGVDSLPLAGGIGRRSRSGAIRLRNLRTFSVGPDEFVVEAYPINGDAPESVSEVRATADTRL
jgi:diaminohydroxyphosphoribosylaminopyrimidine deaminase / 5-amino-6-(5-phosphoribosylamino)uracil reductase